MTATLYQVLKNQINHYFVNDFSDSVLVLFRILIDIIDFFSLTLHISYGKSQSKLCGQCFLSTMWLWR